MAMIFLKRKMDIFMVKIRSKVCCHFGRMSQGNIVGIVSAQCHYIALTICAYTIQARSTTNRETSARNSNSSNCPTDYQS
jgi:hypothetical protein